MTDFRLKDGTGTGEMAKVDDHGRLAVNAIQVSHEQHHSTYHEDLFTGSFEVVLPDGLETNLLFYKNTNPGRDYEFYGARLSCNANIKLGAYSGRTYSTGGSAPKINNMNLGSGNVPVYEGYEGGDAGDLALLTSDEEDFGSTYIGPYVPYVVDFKGGLILPPNKTFCMTATGSAATSVSVTLLFSRHSAGYKL